MSWRKDDGRDGGVDLLIVDYGWQVRQSQVCTVVVREGMISPSSALFRRSFFGFAPKAPKGKSGRGKVTMVWEGTTKG